MDICINCDSTDISIEEKTYGIPYGPKLDRFSLPVTTPVHICNNCGDEWTDWEAEDIIGDAIHKHRIKENK